jgi:hypothetical protein
MTEHEWRPCYGIRPTGVRRKYYCAVCHRQATEREILTEVLKECGGKCFSNGVHP